MTRIICHRGACFEAPENTIASALRAIELGGDWIELDIRQSRDGVLYVLHDDTVDRTTNGIGPIAEMLSRDVDELDAGSWFAPAFAGERVPRLEAFLKTLRSKVGGFYLESKACDPEALAELINQLGVASICMHGSDNAVYREQMRRHAPGVAAMVHWSVAGSVDAAIEMHGAQIVEFETGNLDQSAVLACKAAGLKTQLWTDRFDTSLYRRALVMGLDFMNIDHINEFNEIRSSMPAQSVGSVASSKT